MTQTAQVTVRRTGRPGDLGWAVMTHGEIYARQFGYDQTFEALVAGIVGDFATGADPAREACWIAEIDGVRAGCVMLVADAPRADVARADVARADVARLRVLLVTPAARGHGVGTRLVEECLAFARDAGYRRVVLFTTDQQVAARRLYEAAGFTLTERDPQRRWGHDLVEETWVLDLS